MQLAALYFSHKCSVAVTEDKLKRIEGEIRAFYEERYEVPSDEAIEAGLLGRKKLDFKFLVEFLHRKDVIPGGLKSKLEKLWGSLNSYVHVVKLEVVKPECPGCPAAAVNVIEEELRLCITYFQDIAAVFLRILLGHLDQAGLLFDDEVLKSFNYGVWSLDEIGRELGTSLILSDELKRLAEEYKAHTREVGAVHFRR